MTKATCLIVIFNHRYDKNLKRIKELYQDRFDDIYVLMPFYDGEQLDGLNIIPVYDSSFQFNGYIAQAFFHINKVCSYTHYVVIGDDLIINPALNQNNIAEKMGLDKSTSYIKNLTVLGRAPGITSQRLYQEVLSPFIFYNGTEWKKLIYNPEEAFSLVNDYNPKLSVKWMLKYLVKGNAHIKIKHILQRILYLFPCLVITCRKGLPYPLYKDYCDFLVLSGKDIEKIVHYFGVFAAMQIFVEVAIPTAMKLVCKTIKTEADIPYHGIEYWTEKDISSFYNMYDGSLNKLFVNWDSDVLYYHPIKLSKWT